MSWSVCLPQAACGRLVQAALVWPFVFHLNFQQNFIINLSVPQSNRGLLVQMYVNPIYFFLLIPFVDKGEAAVINPDFSFLVWNYWWELDANLAT